MKAGVVVVTGDAKSTVVLSFVGFIVLCSSVAHHKCLWCLYSKYHSPSSMEFCPSGEGRRVCIQAVLYTCLTTNSLYFPPSTECRWSWIITIMQRFQQRHHTSNRRRVIKLTVTDDEMGETLLTPRSPSLYQILQRSLFPVQRCKVFLVILVKSTGGGWVSSGGHSIITITSGDYPYRAFSSVFDPPTVSENASVIMVTECLGWRDQFRFSCRVYQEVR